MDLVIGGEAAVGQEVIEDDGDGLIFPSLGVRVVFGRGDAEFAKATEAEDAAVAGGFGVQHFGVDQEMVFVAGGTAAGAELGGVGAGKGLVVHGIFSEFERQRATPHPAISPYEGLSSRPKREIVSLGVGAGEGVIFHGKWQMANGKWQRRL
jgi:hypothetical protein